MNNFKLPSLQLTSCDVYRSTNRQVQFHKWAKRMKFQPSSVYGLLNASDNRIDSDELNFLKESAKNMKIHLPLSMDPNRHFGYEIIPENSHLDDDNSIVCCELEGFLPSRPPYIPLILRCLVNNLEDSSTNIEYLYSKASNFGTRAKRILINLSNCKQDYTMMNNVIRHEDVQNVALAVLLFLRSLCPVLLLQIKLENFTNKRIKRNYDACLHCSCFIMIHLLHIWEYSKDPITSLCLISRVFAPILLQHKDSEHHDQEALDNFTNLMLNYDYEFWYELSRYPMKIIRLFNGVTGKESKYLNYRNKKLNC